MLQVTNLTKKYGKVLACDDLTFALPDQSITILLGPNGAGKSTLFKSIIGFLRVKGSVMIDGVYHKELAAKRLCGYVPEIPSLYPNLTVWEHMEFIARAYRLKNWREWGEELFTRFELQDKRKKFGDELSKGMQQKLNVCLGLLPLPKVILFDEPMIGLDPHAIKELKKIFVELKEKGCTVFVSTHMIDSVDMLWDRALIMKNGRICADLARDAQQDESLEELFFRITEGENAAGEGK